MKENTLDKDLFVKKWAKKANFTQGDIVLILDSLIETLEDCVKEGNSVKVKGLGILNIGKIRARKGYDAVRGKATEFPEAVRVNFRLSDNIRFAYKNSKGGTED